MKSISLNSSRTEHYTLLIALLLSVFGCDARTSDDPIPSSVQPSQKVSPTTPRDVDNEVQSLIQANAHLREELELTKAELDQKEAELSRLNEKRSGISTEAQENRRKVRATVTANDQEVNGFKFCNVSMMRSVVGLKIIGEIKNGSGKTYKAAWFKINIYDGENRLLDVSDIMIEKLENGQQTSFETFATHVTGDEATAYKFEFNSTLSR